MQNSLIIGGSNGLGLEIAKRYVERQKEGKAIIVARSITEPHTGENVEYVNLDLRTAEIEDFERIMLNNWPISSICFSQRYRANKDLNENKKSSSASEYDVMVLATSRAIEALRNCYCKNSHDGIFTRIVVIGSTYSVSVGHDQELSYHLCKSGQFALVKFYSLNANGRFNINLLSPATYVKKGAEKYWEKTTKADIWGKLSPKRLARVEEIAEEAVDLMTMSSIFNSGNNIFLDGGTSHLYPDQISNI